MSHCSNYEEAVRKHDPKYLAYLNSYGYDPFYNKKRNYPDAEERLYDDFPEVDLVLVRKGYTRIGGRHVTGKFLPETSRCLITSTKRELAKFDYFFENGIYVVSKDACYVVEYFHYNQFPKYPILTLSPISDPKHLSPIPDLKHLHECYKYVMGRVAKGLPVQHTLPHYPF